MAIQFAVGRVSVTTTATQIVAARAGRTEIRFRAITTPTSAALFVGPDSGVTSGTGYRIANLISSDNQFVSLPVEGALYAITDNNTAVVSYIEIYDDGM
jgi:hypothetical protein